MRASYVLDRRSSQLSQGPRDRRAAPWGLRLLLLRPVVVGAEIVWRLNVAPRRHHLGGVGALRVIDFLEERVLGLFLLGDLVPAFQNLVQNLVGRTLDVDAVLLPQLDQSLGILLVGDGLGAERRLPG